MKVDLLVRASNGLLTAAIFHEARGYFCGEKFHVVVSLRLGCIERGDG